MSVVLGKPKPKRKKKTPRQLLEIELDDIVREIVLNRDASCVCPAPKNGHSFIRQPGHLISRKNKATRWSLLNTHCQCSSCNLLHNFKPEIYTAWFVDKFGSLIYQKLVKDSQEVRKYQPYELEELLSQLKEIRQVQIACAEKFDFSFKPYFNQQDILSGVWSVGAQNAIL